jgi:transcriptional regulator with XRE-family HTH domain
MTNQIPVGQKIRLARNARRMTMRDLGAKLGRTYGWVVQIEQGEISLKLDDYEKIQAALGYRFDTPEAQAAFSFFLNGHS